MTAAHLAAGERLRAVTTRIDAPGELLDHLGAGGFAWFGEGVSFVTAGVAATVGTTDAARALQAIRHDAPGIAPLAARPLAVGALPFAGSGSLTIPSLVVGATGDGYAWATRIGAAPTAPAPAPVPVAPSRFDVRGVADRAAWAAAVEYVLARIASGDVEKVVLSREVRIDADRAFDLGALLAHLRRAQPGCFVFADGGFVGATPELLVRRRGRDVSCRPMAGTLPRRGRDDPRAALRSSGKDAHEHTVVIDAVTHELDRWCGGLSVSEPEAVAFADVVHLVTHVDARVTDPTISALDLACALHPTPAVAGTPRDRALALIEQLEPTPRGNYAGPVGWVNADGDGEFAVALRCAQVDGSVARLHAGAGIVAGSIAGAEWDETGAKFDPMLRALVRP